MNTKDFDFLIQKEFLILCLLLLSLTFTQISLEQLSGSSSVKPFLILNISLFEIIGLFLPLFTGIYLFFTNKSKQQFTFPPLIIFFGIALISILIFTFLASTTLFEEESPVWPEINSSVSITTQEVTESAQLPPVPADLNQLDTNAFVNSLLELRSLFFVGVIFLSLLLIILSRRNSVLKKTVVMDGDESPIEGQEKTYRMKTVLECYYQASTSLEERGADDSPSFTPTEFTKDVITKTLTSPPLIEGITNLFEEVKFSNHNITDQEVDQAKSLASKIIFSAESPSNLKECKEPEEIE